MLKKRLLKHILTPSPWEKQKTVKDPEGKEAAAGYCFKLYCVTLPFSCINARYRTKNITDIPSAPK